MNADVRRKFPAWFRRHCAKFLISESDLRKTFPNDTDMSRTLSRLNSGKEFVPHEQTIRKVLAMLDVDPQRFLRDVQQEQFVRPQQFVRPLFQVRDEPLVQYRSEDYSVRVIVDQPDGKVPDKHSEPDTTLNQRNGFEIRIDIRRIK